MLKILNLIILGCGLALVVALAGFALTWAGTITTKNSKKYATLAATLLAGLGMWLSGHVRISAEHASYDLVVTFFAMWFMSLFVFWAGIAVGLSKKYGHKRGHEHDFGESSMLSMQFMDTRMHESLGVHPANFQETEILLVKQPAHADVNSKTPAAQTEHVIHIPVTRHNG